MADYFTQFSCIFDVGSAENAHRAEAIREEYAADVERDEGSTLGFEMQIERSLGAGALWLSSDEQGEPEHVIEFVLRCAKALNLAGVWGFTWSHSCSKPRIDGFGGGAHVLDLGAGRSLADIDCSNFVHEQVAKLATKEMGAPS